MVGASGIDGSIGSGGNGSSSHSRRWDTGSGSHASLNGWSGARGNASAPQFGGGVEARGCRRVVQIVAMFFRCEAALVEGERVVPASADSKAADGS